MIRLRGTAIEHVTAPDIPIYRHLQVAQELTGKQLNLNPKRINRRCINGYLALFAVYRA